MRPGALLFVGTVVLLTWLVLSTAGLWWFYAQWEARIVLRNQPVTLKLPAGMRALAEIDAPLKTHLDIRPRIHVPVKQAMNVRIDDALQAQVQVHALLPVDTSVTLDRSIPVRTNLQASLRLRSWLPRMDVVLPVSFELPVHITVPVKTNVPIDLDVLVSGQLPPSLTVPVDTAFDLQPRLQADIDARILSQTAFQLSKPLPPIDMEIAETRLRVPFDLTLLRARAGREQPSR